MIGLKKISLSELREYVEIAYKGDDDLLLHYWGEDFNLEEAVNETMSLVNYVDNEVPVDYYAVVLDEEEIGYLVRFQNNLFSFSININYRTKDNLISFWEQIKGVMEDGFICNLFPQNIRAANWLKKCGMVEVFGVENNCVTMLNISNI